MRVRWTRFCLQRHCGGVCDLVGNSSDDTALFHRVEQVA